MSCAVSVVASQGLPDHTSSRVEVPVEVLREVVQRFGTPAYAYDLARIRSQVAKLRSNFPSSIDLLYSLKANASLGICGFLADCGLGADVASAGELLTALEAGFAPSRILMSGPDSSPAMLAQLASVPEAIVSVDSLSELTMLAGREQSHRALLRLRPDFRSAAECSAGPDSRFGLVLDELPRCREYLSTRGIRVVGFHVFAGSQVLDAAAIVRHIHSAVTLSLRAADVLGMIPEIIDLGGGFGIPYGLGEQELALEPVADELRSCLERAAPARLVLELGRYFVAQAGWYLTTVIARQTHQGREAVVVDGGSHQRADLCGLGLRRKAMGPVPLEEKGGTLVTTDVLGCLSLPADILAEAKPLPPLNPGDVLAFPNAGAYGLWASPALFHCHPLPAEVAFEDGRLELLRARQLVAKLLEGQKRISRPASPV
jgi:diaminopimelate decarboxylase